MQGSVMLVMGTRPEAIKLIPLYYALKQVAIPVVLCSTAQHSTLLDEVLNLFNITPDIDFDIMKPGQDLFYITQEVMRYMKQALHNYKPRCVVVQGDTTSAMAGSLSAFYMKIPVVHVEAGLRTNTVTYPYPEELNRRIISLTTSLHCVPTAWAMANMLAEKVERESVVLTGNTVVDALRIVKERIENNTISVSECIKNLITSDIKNYKKLVLFTMHRRESFPHGIRQVLQALKEYALRHPEILFIYPYHPNPCVLEALDEVKLNELDTIYLTSSLVYADLVYILLHADCVVTDSGGIYEEAVSLKRRVIIVRNETERPEGLWAGYAELVGFNKERIYKTLDIFLTMQNTCDDITESIYGDGYAAQKIVRALKERFLPQEDVHEKGMCSRIGVHRSANSSCCSGT